MSERDDGRVLDVPALRRALRDGWYLICAGAFVGVGAGSVYGLVAPVRYEAESRIYLTVVGASSVQDLVQGADYAQQVLQSYAEVASSPLVLDPVANDLGLGEGSEIVSSVDVTPVPDTSLLDVVVTWPNPGGAASIANDVTRRLGDVSDRLSRDRQGSATVRLSQIAEATPAVAPASPNRMLAVVAGLLAGLVSGVLLALARAAGTGRIRNLQDYADTLDAPQLGETLWAPRARRTGITMLTAGDTPAAERYRALRTNLRYLSADSPAVVLLVTSALQSEGKTTLAANLAVSMAQAGKGVVLVEADMRRPRLAETMGLEGALGLSDVLAGESDAQSVLQSVGSAPSLSLISAGPVPPNPSELLASERMRSVLRQLSESFEVVVVDSPPLLPVADASVLAPEVDAVLLAAAAGRSMRSAHRRAYRMLESIGASRIALVLTMVKPRESSAGAQVYA